MTLAKPWVRTWTPGDDKVEHFMAGTVTAIGLFFLMAREERSWRLLVLFAFLAVMGSVGIWYGKEVWDSFGHGNPDWWDWGCSVLGAVTVGLVAIIAYVWIRTREKA
jgi:uncharacterized membrane protein YcjF (UPF0283 family)